MTIHIELWQLLTAIGSITAFVVTAFWVLASVIARQARMQIEAEFKTIGKHLDMQDERMKTLETQVTELRIELPRDYTRRDDHIRDIGTIATKIESLALYFERVVRDAPSDILKLIRDEVRKEPR